MQGDEAQDKDLKTDSSTMSSAEESNGNGKEHM